VKKLLCVLAILAVLVAVGVKTGVIRVDHPVDA
jgi:hypothetical protein